MASFCNVALVFLVVVIELQGFVHANFGSDVTCYWGPKNFYTWNNGNNCALQLTNDSGSGIKTWQQFQYGVITMQIQLVPKNSAGTVTTYYMSSVDNTKSGDKHDEIDFEFLGNVSGQPYTIHTNLFANGNGNKEIQFRPWFDPTTGYHNYTIFWNPCQVVWYIDWIPIRVFKNYKNIGINFPYQAMRAFSSLWNGDSWATQGGKIKINWSNAPFTAKYQGLKLDACPTTKTDCFSTNYWYNNKCSLTDAEKGQLLWVWKNFKIYDYCEDSKRFNGTKPSECYQERY